MAPAGNPTADEQDILSRGLDYLGRESDINLVGGQDIAAGVQGLPAASTPGGMAGFAGGAGRPGAGGGGQGSPDIMGFIKKILGEVGTGKAPGELGGSMPTQGGPTGGIENMIGDEAMPTQVGDGTAGPVAPEGAESMPFTQALPGLEYFNTPEGLAALGELGIDTAGMGGVAGAGGGLSTLGTVGAGAGGLGGLYGIYSGIQSLMEGGDPASGAMQLGAGGLGTYGALSTLFPSMFPSLTATIGSALGTTAGAAGGAGASAGAGAAAGAAGAGAALPLGMVAGPYIVAKLIQAAHAMGPDKANARQLGNRVENIYGQLPGMISQIQGIPDIASRLTSASTPEETAAILKQLNTLQDQYQAGGWESHQKSGVTTVKGVGDESGGAGMGADLSGVQQALDQMNPYFHTMDLTRLRAQDALSKAGWTPEQIQAQTGRYVSPQEWAMQLNAQNYTGTGRSQPMYQDFNPTFNSQFRPDVSGPGFRETQMARAGVTNDSQLNDLLAAMQNPGAEMATVGGYDPRAINAAQSSQGDFMGTPYGTVNRSMYDQLAGIAPGNLEQGLMQYLQPYGGVNPGMMQMGFGQGLRAPSPVAAQINAMIGAGGGRGDAGTGLNEGLIPEEERRRLGQ